MKQHPTYPLLFSLHAMIVLLLLTVLNNRTEAQQANRPFLRELSFVTDNDNYDLGFTDRYYTNGFFLRLHWVHDSAGASATVRRIRRAELAHKTYNPVLNRTTRFAVLREMDRPYAGWLYASRGETRIYPRHSVLQLDASLGVMGPAAGGREVQNSWHNVFGLPEALAWDQQVRNSIDLSLRAAYYQAVVSDPSEFTSIHLFSRVTAGTILNNAAIGLLYKTGFIRSEATSGYWSAQLGQVQTRPLEWMFYFEPTLEYQLYNATVQGSLLRPDKGPFTTGIRPWVVQTALGVLATGNRLGLRVGYTLRGREGEQMKKGEHWGTLGLSYRFQ